MKSLKIYLLGICLCVFSLSVFSQNSSTLLVAEYDENGSVNKIQHLVKYVFKEGEMLSRELIVSVRIEDEKTKKNNVRFDTGPNKIYRNRYVITAAGCIIDIKNKKVLFSQHETFAGFIGDSVVYYTNDIFKGKYFSIYNLKTETYFKIEDPNYKPFSVPVVEVDVFSKPFNIALYDAAGKKTLLVTDAGYGEFNAQNPSKAKQLPPLFWLDKNKKYFLYANYAKTQKSLTMYKVGLDKTIEKIAAIDSVPPAVANSFFCQDAYGNIVYSCGKGRFIIDVKNKTAQKISYENIANGFVIEAAENPAYGRIIKHNNVEIGRKYCRYDNAQTAPDYIAIEYDVVMGTERYSQGVAVWNTTTNKWKRLKLFELANIIGWITE